MCALLHGWHIDYSRKQAAKFPTDNIYFSSVIHGL